VKNILLLLFALILSVPAHSQWKMHVIDNSSSGADGVKLADINHDGLSDITTGWEEGGYTKLYLQPEKSKVKEKWPTVIVGKTPDVEDAVFVDLNNDGKFDVISCSEGSTKKIFVHWNSRDNVLDLTNWKQEVLPASDGLMMWMYAGPLQIDNKNGVDLVAAGKNENASIGWFESPENPNKLNDWKWHEISPVGWIMSIIRKDMDDDGDSDIVISDRRGSLQGCRWLENPGVVDAQKLPWKNHFIGAQNLEVMFMSMTDLDKDGRDEAIVAECTKNTVGIYSAKDKNGNEWEEKSIPIPEFTGKAKSIEVGDINNDGVADFILSTETRGQVKNGIIWLNGKYLENPELFDWQIISEEHISKFDKVELIDLDNDGDLDVLICEENFGEKSEGLGVVWYENPCKKGKLIYENKLSSAEEVNNWKMEGRGVIEFKNGWMEMYSPDEKFHHVFWCPMDFPGSFIAEWELQNLETDAGLCIIFFSAKGDNGESIFDPSFPKRDGTFNQYTKSEYFNNYHISYYANTKDNRAKEVAHLRKNKGFEVVQVGEPGIPVHSDKINKMTLIKDNAHIVMFVDNREIIDWTDDGKNQPVWQDGKIGFRQMQWTHFRYRNLKVWNLKN
jgi:hypothetical protein